MMGGKTEISPQNTQFKQLGMHPTTKNATRTQETALPWHFPTLPLCTHTTASETDFPHSLQTGQASSGHHHPETTNPTTNQPTHQHPKVIPAAATGRAKRDF
jgi:hypothetical protein